MNDPDLFGPILRSPTVQLALPVSHLAISEVGVSPNSVFSPYVILPSRPAQEAPFPSSPR